MMSLLRSVGAGKVIMVTRMPSNELKMRCQSRLKNEIFGPRTNLHPRSEYKKPPERTIMRIIKAVELYQNIFQILEIRTTDEYQEDVQLGSSDYLNRL